jgi:NAD(P)-dependent dehydrogenase (short-subunit alcohol dehydrogenase family)
VGEFDEKRILVTGGTKGAGKAIAERFRRRGATVIIAARSAPEKKRTIILFRQMSQPPKARRK